MGFVALALIDGDPDRTSASCGVPGVSLTSAAWQAVDKTSGTWLFAPEFPVRTQPAGSTRSLLCLTSASENVAEVRSDMRTILALVVVLYSGAALAQGAAPAAGSPPPTVGGKPLVQVKPHGSAPKTEHLSVAKKMLTCLDIDDGTKGRLDCFDAIFPPKPNPKAPAAKGRRRLPLHQGRGRAADLLQRIRRQDPEILTGAGCL